MVTQSGHEILKSCVNVDLPRKTSLILQKVRGQNGIHPPPKATCYPDPNGLPPSITLYRLALRFISIKREPSNILRVF